MQKPRDARARRTAESLQAAMLTLLEEKSLDQITVRDIAAEAGINYATFFRHHPSKEALLDHVASDEISRLVNLTLPTFDHVNVNAALEELFAYVQENRALWKALLTGGAAGIMRDEQLRLSRIVAAERVKKKSWLPLELRVNCSVSLIFETLVWWINQSPEQHSVSEAAKILAKLLDIHGLIPGQVSPRPSARKPGARSLSGE